MQPVRIVLLGLVLVCLAAGCEQKRPGEVPVYPVTGRVTFRGEPMTNAVLTLFPADNPSVWALKPRGYADQNGVYEVTTYERNDGAPLGEYIVTMWWPEADYDPKALENGNEPDRLMRAYFDPTKSKLRATVKPQDNVIDIALP